MSSNDPILKCDTCGDEHHESERDEVDGHKLCPECGSKKAFVIDARPGVGPDELGGA